jgi:predicted MPP superfamily phosphohydrolase
MSESTPTTRIPAAAKPDRRRVRLNRWWYIALAAIIVLGALLGYMYAESRWIEIKHYEYSSPDIPREFDGVTIVLLADIHRGWFFSQERVADLVKRVNTLHPDIVALAGDYIYVSRDYERPTFAALQKLEASLGRFAVLGNHDYGEYEDGTKDPTSATEAIEQAGIELLDNAGVWLEHDGARIRIGGVSDYKEGQPNLAPAVEGSTASDFVLLLCHNPDYVETTPADEVDLMLSGHTHGGQVTFFGLWAPRLPSDYGQKYRTGMVQADASTVIVSNGVGTIFPPLRFFARPQIVEITLRHSGS